MQYRIRDLVDELKSRSVIRAVIGRFLSTSFPERRLPVQLAVAIIPD